MHQAQTMGARLQLGQVEPGQQTGAKRVGGPPTYIVRGIPIDSQLTIQVVTSISKNYLPWFDFLMKRVILHNIPTQTSTEFSFDPEDMYEDMLLLHQATSLTTTTPGDLALLSPVMHEIPITLLPKIKEVTSEIWIDMQGFMRTLTGGRKVKISRPPQALVNSLTLVSLLKFSWEEALTILQDKLPPKKALLKLREVFPSQKLIVSAGEHGAYYLNDHDEPFQIKYDAPVKVKDTTGAGDSFMGGLSSSYLSFKERPFEQHLITAVATATWACEQGDPHATLTRTKQQTYEQYVKIKPL